MPFRLLVIACLFLALPPSGRREAQIAGVAAGIPEPQQRNVIVQLFNWRFVEITDVMPRLKALGYSHVHVSPPQRSNERVREWWGRYQPIDFSRIQGPLGSEAEFRAMNVEADRHGINIVVDVVLNHTIALSEMEPGFVEMDGPHIVREKFPQFMAEDFHPRCDIDDSNADTVVKCWLGDLCDLKTETARVRAVGKAYLAKLVALGVDGFRFDAAKHVEADFFGEVLQAAPNTYAFGEVITSDPRAMPNVEVLDFYDFPLVATMKRAFAFGGDLNILRKPADHNQALPGPRAVTFVRNHDIDRGQARNRGLDEGSQATYGVGWHGPERPLTESDIMLAYAYIFGREDGLPYVFADMRATTGGDKRADLFDDERLTAFIRFHNLSLAAQDGVARREDIFLEINSSNALAWQRGTDRLVLLNKAAERFPVRDLQTTLRPGRYIEVRTGSPLDVEADGRIREWDVPGQTAVMFVPRP